MLKILRGHFDPRYIRTGIKFENKTGSVRARNLNPKYTLAHKLYNVWQKSEYWHGPLPIKDPGIHPKYKLKASEIDAVRFTDQILLLDDKQAIRATYRPFEDAAIIDTYNRAFRRIK